MSTVFLVRSPVFDRRGKVWGYELATRSATADDLPVGAPRSGEALVRAILDAGILRLVGTGTRAILTIPLDLAHSPELDRLPTDRFIVELRTSEGGVEATSDAAAALARRDIDFAIDEALLLEGGIPHPRTRFVRLQLTEDRSRLRTRIDAVKKHKLRALVAGVETPEEFAGCSAFGFDYFRGSFFAKPRPQADRLAALSNVALFHLLTRLQDPSVSIHELEVLIQDTPELTDKLLRLVNSACSGTSERVETIRGAMLVLGMERVVSLVSMVAFSSLPEKPQELILGGMVRAKMCEALAVAEEAKEPEKAFSVGMLSQMEALLDQPMSTILSRIPLAPDIREALLNPEGAGSLGRHLRVVQAYERGDWASVESLVPSPEDCPAAYLRGLDFAASASEAIAA